MPFDGVFIDQNSGPYGYCFGECPNGLADQAKSPKDTPNDDILEAGWWQGFNDQSSNSTYNLPFIPGNYATSDNLDYYTASLNGTHPGDNSNEYDVHSLYGHASGKATYNAIRQSTNATLQDKLPYVTSRGSFAGSGQYMGHTFSVINRPGRMKNEVELMRYRIANIMNFNMFGMPMSGPDVISDIIADKETKVNYTASYIQFNAFTPLAQVFDAELFVDPAYAAQAALVKAAMNERLSFIHLFHTCMFEAHD
jgi:alpha-glucosidase